MVDNDNRSRLNENPEEQAKLILYQSLLNFCLVSFLRQSNRSEWIQILDEWIDKQWMSSMNSQLDVQAKALSADPAALEKIELARTLAKETAEKLRKEIFG
jgi:hypothetical protein